VNKEMSELRKRKGPKQIAYDSKGRPWWFIRATGKGKDSSQVWIFLPADLIRDIGLKVGDVVLMRYDKKTKTLHIRKGRIIVDFEE